MKPGPANYKPYPSDVSDEEWSFVAPYLTLNRLDGENRKHDLRGVQRTALAGAQRRPLAHDAARIPAMAGGISADAALAGGGLFRGDGARSAGAAAGIRRPQGAAQCGDTGQPHPAVGAGIRGARGLRGGQTGARAPKSMRRSIRWGTCWRCT
jgi:hypothetical protein